MSSENENIKEKLKKRANRKKWQYSTYSYVDDDVKNYFPFLNPRENQLETISEIKHAIEEGYKYIVLEAGTGTGKSAIAATLALMYDSSYILTVTKQLQDQYLNDFADLDFKLVKGRSNFRCRKYAEENIDSSCDEGRCVIEGYKCEYSIKNNRDDLSLDKICYYDWQKFQGLISDVVISNYAYLFLELNYVGDFTKRELMIFDEAHNVESMIMNQLTLEFNRKDLKEYLGVNLSKKTVDELNNGDYKVWIEFIKKIQGKYKKEYDKIKKIKKEGVSQKRIYLKERIDDCRNFISYIRKDPDKWIFDYDKQFGKGEFKPVKVDKYAKETFFNYGGVCIFMSATILDYKLFTEWLGLDENEVYAIRKKSPFKINRNPIVTFDDFDMTYANLNDTAPKTIHALNQILDNHKNEKGIIHTVSYNCKNYLKEKLDSKRLIDHKTYNRSYQLNKFKKSTEPLVLISPSMNEGVDLPGDLCRFQIIYKLPYPNLVDKQTNKRMKMDPKWYKYKTALSLVQTVGRGMRYEDDYCMTYFMDSRLNEFVFRDGISDFFLPDTFKDAINIEPARIDKSQIKPVIADVNLKDEIKHVNGNILKTDEDVIDFDKYLEGEYYRNVDLKYDLTMKGDELLKNNQFGEALKFYNKLLTHELFIHDYHPYIKLAKAYHGLKDYDMEVNVLISFFKSGLYARRSTVKWFKNKLTELSELGYFDLATLNDLEKDYKKSPTRKRKFSRIPVPWAVDIKSGKKNMNKKAKTVDDSIFNDILCDEKLTREDLIEIGEKFSDLKNYPKAIAFYKRLLSHDLFKNDTFAYEKLSVLLRKDKQKIEEIKILIRFFKSGIRCDEKKLKWFESRLKQLSNYGHFNPEKIKDLRNEYYDNSFVDNSKSDLRKITKYSHSATHENYSVKYFNNLAKEVENQEGFISDRELLEHSEDDFIYIGTSNIQFNKKAELKNKAKELESEDAEKAIEFYDELKTNELFENDYYPYRRQCILYKNKLKDDIKDWKTIKEIFKNKIHLNKHQYIWLYNKILELAQKLDMSESQITEMRNLVEDFNINRYLEPEIPIAERILKEDDEVKVLSQEKYDELQELFYVKELGVGYIRRKEYDSAFPYYFKLLENDFLYFRYHAYKQFARLYREIDNHHEFTRLFEKYKY